MDNGDRREFGEMWRAVRAEYGQEVTKTGLSLAFAVLERFTLDEVKAGIAMHMSDTNNGQYKIQTAHVIANIEGRGDERAGVAWSKLYRAIGAVGSYSDAVFDDAIIHAIVEKEGGWIKVCLMVENDLKYMQARFNKQYVQLVSKSGVFAYPKVLSGTINLDRKARGLELDPPVTIGEVNQCRLVYRGGTDVTLEINHPKTANEIIATIENQTKEIEK